MAERKKYDMQLAMAMQGTVHRPKREKFNRKSDTLLGLELVGLQCVNCVKLWTPVDRNPFRFILICAPAVA